MHREDNIVSSYQSIVFYIIRLVLFTPPLLALGLITLPLILIFKWEGFWVLWVANFKNYSLQKARKFVRNARRNNIAYQTRKTPLSESVCIDTSHITSPTYSWRSGNVYNNRHWDA